MLNRTNGPSFTMSQLQVWPPQRAALAAVGGRGRAPVAAGHLGGQAPGREPEVGGPWAGLAADPRAAVTGRPGPPLRRRQGLPRVCQAHPGQLGPVQVGDCKYCEDDIGHIDCRSSLVIVLYVNMYPILTI